MADLPVFDTCKYDDYMNSHGSGGHNVIAQVAWGVAQSWGGKVILFLLFILLARLLTPTEFGVVSAAATLLLMVTQFAEFGFGDAIVQRKTLESRDINLPFFMAMSLSVLLAIGLFVFSDGIERYLRVAGLSSVIKVMCVLAPLTTLSQFQEMLYRRNLLFQKLALRVFFCNTVAGLAAVVVAHLGGGEWSLVVQALGTVVLSISWLWMRPQWKPSLDVDLKSFWEIKKFSVNVVSTRVLDFVSTRLIEFMIVSMFGAVALGLYAAGARLYTTLLQLFQGGLSDVALSLLSRISHDREKLSNVYLKTSSLSAMVASPVFVCLALLSQEVCDIFFGNKWDGVAGISRPLFLVGAVQCVQFVNATYLSAKGRPALVLVLNVIKAPAVVLALLSAKGEGVVLMIYAFCIAQMASTPFSFAFVVNVLGLSWLSLVKRLMPIVLCLIASYVVGEYVRLAVLDAVKNVYLKCILVGGVFFVVNYGLLALVARHQVLESFGFVFDRIRRR